LIVHGGADRETANRWTRLCLDRIAACTDEPDCHIYLWNNAPEDRTMASSLAARPSLTLLDAASYELLDHPHRTSLQRLYHLDFHQDTLTSHPDWFEPDHPAHEQRLVGVGLDRMLGLPLADRLPTERIGAKKNQVDISGYRASTALALIEQAESLTRYDHALYAGELFEQQWAHYQARPRRTYRIAAHICSRLQPVKVAGKRVIRWRPPQNREGA
jgi:hypothetical protein